MCLSSLQLLLIGVHKPLFTKQPAYSNHPEVNFETARVAGVIQECGRYFAGIGVEEVGHLVVSFDVCPTRYPRVC
jgi:hypothetical protein